MADKGLISQELANQNKKNKHFRKKLLPRFENITAPHF